MPQVSIARLFEETGGKLQLDWIAGRNGADKGIDSDFTKDSSKGLVGHLNFIHPNVIQVLGDSEVDYLNGLDAAECRGMLERAAVAILAEAGRPMRLADVYRALDANGYAPAKHGMVRTQSVLANSPAIERVARGLYRVRAAA